MAAVAFRDDVAQYSDWPATVMAVDCTGQYAILGLRRGLACIDLKNPSTIIKKVTRNSKWECGTIEWNPHLSHAHLLASSSNQKIEIWCWRDGSAVQQQMLKSHTRAVRDSKKPATSLQAVVGASQVKWNRVNRHVLATSHDGDVRIWDLRKGNTAVTYITAHLSKIHGLDWSHSRGTSLATCSNDSTVKLWDTENPRQPEAKLNANHPVWRARYTPFGEGLVTVVVPQLRRGENSLSLWNCLNLSTPVPSPVYTFVDHNDVVLEFQWRSQTLHDEKQFQLITWSKDQSLRFCSVEPRIIKACSVSDHDDYAVKEQGGESLDSTFEGAIGSLEIIPDTAAQPQTLRQEFALINVNIPNVIVEQAVCYWFLTTFTQILEPLMSHVFDTPYLRTLQMDAGHRSCTVSVTRNIHKMDAGHRSCTVLVTSSAHLVTLVINFPSMYPNNAIPSFEFSPDGTSIDSNTRTKLIKTLRETAQNHVKLNQTCLEPCLRQLVSHLEELTEENDVNRFTTSVPHIQRRLNVDPYGSYQDAAVPFPRTSGAHFAACGLLVSFSLPGTSSGEPTPRSLSAFSAYTLRPSSGPALPPLVNSAGAHQRHTFSSFSDHRLSGHRIFFRSTSQDDSEGRQRKRYGSVPSRGSNVAHVVIRDVSVLIPIHQSLAQSYTLEGRDVIEVCKKNLAAVKSVGRKDLVQTWSLLGQILDDKLAPSDSMGGTPWALHPFGRAMLYSLLEYYLSIRDIQMLGMLSCILCHHSLPGSFKPPKPRHQSLAVSKSFTFGESAANPSVKRSKSVVSGSDSSPVGSWSEIIFPPVDTGWSPSPVLVHARDPHEEEIKLHEKNCRLLQPSKVPLLDHFMTMYADVLYRWHLLDKRAEVLKFLSGPSEAHKGVEFSTRCHHCDEKLRGAQCWSCKGYGFQCSLCHVAVRGASNFCMACGHGGHTYHMMTWFDAMDVCPTGCGCRCLDSGTFIVD